MTRMKRWESPRREGRNDKGRGGTARQKQLRKQTQMLRKKLQDGTQPKNEKGEDALSSLPLFFKRTYGLKFNCPFSSARSWITQLLVAC